MKVWNYSGLREYIISQFDGSEIKVLELTPDLCERLAQEYNSQYNGYKTTEHLIGNVGGVIREALVGTEYRVRCDYKNMKVIITQNSKSVGTIKPTEPVEHVRILPVRATDYLVRDVPKYVPQWKELEIIDAHMDMEKPQGLLFVGPKGTGKTLSIAYYAYMNDIPLIQYDCSESTKRQDLIGRFLLIGDEVVYELGVLPTAIEVANQYGKAILVLEELNALTPAMMKCLNQILDWRQHVYIPEIGKIYYCNNDRNSKLLICATMNPSYYSGVYELTEDLRSRFAECHFGYPSESKEHEILMRTTELPDELRNLIVTLAIETRKGVESGELSYALSTRDIVMFAELYNQYILTFDDTETALIIALNLTVVNRYDDKLEKDAIKTRIQSIFGVEV